MKTNETAYLFVDLDGTLIHTDLMFESIFLLLGKNIFWLFFFPFWLFKGTAYFKHRIAGIVVDVFTPESLPINARVLEYIAQFKKKNQAKVFLATGSTEILVHKFAKLTPVFDDIFSSDETTNLIGKEKLKKIREICTGNFTYMGDAKTDIDIWNAGRRAVIVSGKKNPFQSDLHSDVEVRVLSVNCNPIRDMIEQLGVRRWFKHILLFVPLIFSDSLLDLDVFRRAVLAFASFSLAAASIYAINDLFCLQEDRTHREKMWRPLAKGTIGIHVMMIRTGFLTVSSLLLPIFLPAKFIPYLFGYFFLTIVRIAVLKKIYPLNTLALGLRYPVLIFAGFAATGIALPF